MSTTKLSLLALMVILIATLLTGCGEDSETSAPSVPLTASTVTSQGASTTSLHDHTVSIPFTDISGTAGSSVIQYRSSVANGHSHVIALTSQQISDINNGMRLEVTSSSPDAGADHTHLWTIQGGAVLYEKYCYNCHSNGKRGAYPMNVSFNSAQTNAVINPAGAPLSNSAAATPDPNYQGTTIGTLDGAALYATSCAGCHGTLASTSKPNRTMTQIKNAITSNSGGMASLGGLTDAQLQAIADALVQ